MSGLLSIEYRRKLNFKGAASSEVILRQPL
jgi:hypothetical protein